MSRIAVVTMLCLWGGAAFANPSTAVHPAKHPHMPQPSHLQQRCMKAFPNDHAAFKRCLQSKGAKNHGDGLANGVLPE